LSLTALSLLLFLLLLQVYCSVTMYM